jgi:hypothetical protein
MHCRWNETRPHKWIRTFSDFRSSVIWTWDCTLQGFWRRCLHRHCARPVLRSSYNNNNNNRDLSATWRTNRQLNLKSIVLHDLLPWERKINDQSMDYDIRRCEVWKICVKRSQWINDLTGINKLMFVDSVLVFLENYMFMLSGILIKTDFRINISSAMCQSWEIETISCGHKPI